MGVQSAVQSNVPYTLMSPGDELKPLPFNSVSMAVETDAWTGSTGSSSVEVPVSGYYRTITQICYFNQFGADLEVTFGLQVNGVDIATDHISSPGGGEGCFAYLTNPSWPLPDFYTVGTVFSARIKFDSGGGDELINPGSGESENFNFLMVEGFFDEGIPEKNLCSDVLAILNNQTQVQTFADDGTPGLLYTLEGKGRDLRLNAAGELLVLETSTDETTTFIEKFNASGSSLGHFIDFTDLDQRAMVVDSDNTVWVIGYLSGPNRAQLIHISTTGVIIASWTDLEFDDFTFDMSLDISKKGLVYYTQYGRSTLWGYDPHGVGASLGAIITTSNSTFGVFRLMLGTKGGAVISRVGFDFIANQQFFRLDEYACDQQLIGWQPLNTGDTLHLLTHADKTDIMWASSTPSEDAIEKIKLNTGQHTGSFNLGSQSVRIVSCTLELGKGFDCTPDRNKFVYASIIGAN